MAIVISLLSKQLTHEVTMMQYIELSVYLPSKIPMAFTLTIHSKQIIRNHNSI